MGSINEKLDYLNETKQLIRSSLVQRGQVVDDSTPFRDYASKILNIDTQSDFIDNRTVVSDFVYQDDGYYMDKTNPDDYKVNTTVLCIGNLYSADYVLEQTAFVIYQIVSVSDGNAHCKVVDILDEYNIGDIKLFETEDEMNSDSSAKEGDLAVVYKNSLHNMTSSEQLKILSFPESVTLSSAVTGGVGCNLVSSDGSIIEVYLYESYFSFNSNMGRGFNIRYESSDGIHFIRNSFSYNSNNLSNPVHLDESYSVQNQGNWDDRFGYFIQISDINFEGLYKYSGYTDDNYLDFPYKFSLSGEIINCEYSSPLYIKDIQETIYNIVEQELGEGIYDLNIHFKDFDLNGNPTKCTIFNGIADGVTIRYCSDDTKFYLSSSSISSVSSTKSLTLIEVDLVNKQSLGKSTKSYTTTEYSSGTSSMNYAYNFEEIVYNDIYASLRLYVGGTSWKYSWVSYYISAKYNTNISGSDFKARYSTLYKYQIAPNQLTLTSASQLLPDVSAYGGNGIVTGDGSIYDNTLTPTEYNESNATLDEILEGYKPVDATQMNLFIQTSEPENKNGIWVETDTQYENKVAVQNALSETGEYLQLSSIPYNFRGGSAVLFGNDIYLFGSSSYKFYNYAYKYNILTNDYTRLTDIPYDFYDGSAVLFGNDIYLFGSRAGSYGNYAYKYNITSNTYTKITDIPYNFYSGSITLIEDNVYLFGGGTSTSYKLAYKYNITSNTYTKITDIPYKFYNGSTTSIGNDIYLFGGGTSGDSYRNAYKYDILTNGYTQLANIPYNFNDSSVVSIGSDVYLFGSLDSDSHRYVYRYDSLTNTYTRLTDIPFDFYSSSVVLSGTDIYLLGGNTGTYNYKFMIALENSIPNNSLVFEQGGMVYKTILFDSGFVNGIEYKFTNIWLKNADGTIDNTTKVYYGDGAKWVQFKGEVDS